MGILIVLMIIAVPMMWYVSVYNDIKRYQIKIQESFSNIDIALAKRYQVLMKLMDVAKAYAKYEKETLLSIIQVRQGMSLDEKEVAYSQIESGYQRVNFLSENYPELKADRLFLNLQDAVVETEDNLSAARRIYNSNIAIFNQRIETFPGNIAAESLNVKSLSMLKFEAAELQNPDLGW